MWYESEGVAQGASTLETVFLFLFCVFRFLLNNDVGSEESYRSRLPVPCPLGAEVVPGHDKNIIIIIIIHILTQLNRDVTSNFWELVLGLRTSLKGKY